MSFQDDLPTKSLIFDYWKDRFQDVGIFVDWGEPSCWACKFHYGTKYDIKRSDATMAEILDGWDRIPLQRCHIVPRSLGGADDVWNLFLMCRECHDLAPNTDVPELFYEWARGQCHYVRASAKFQAAFKSFGVRDSDHAEFIEFIESADFRSWLSGKFGLHRPQSNYASITSRLTPATIVGLAVYYRRSRS